MKQIVFKIFAAILVILTVLTIGALDSDGFFFEKVLFVLLIIDGTTLYIYNERERRNTDGARN